MKNFKPLFWTGIPVLLILVAVAGYHVHSTYVNNDSIRTLLEGDSAILNHSQIPEPDSTVKVDSSMMLTTDIKPGPTGYYTTDAKGKLMDSVYDGRYYVMHYKRVPDTGFVIDTMAFQDSREQPVYVQYQILYNRRLVLRTAFTQPPARMDSVDWTFDFHPENLKK